MFKKIKKFPPFLTSLFYFILRTYSLLVRKEFIDISGSADLSKFPLITVTWHNRILFFPLMFNKKIREQTCAVISASRDGEYLSDLIKCFGIKPIRGSSKKKGFSALNESIRMIKEGRTVCFTPDGPRGPKYKMSQGPIVTASITGRPLVPLAINYSKYWQMKTWDNFRIPKPFSKVTVFIGEPISIPPDLSDEELKKWIRTVEEKLNSVSEPL